MGPEGLFPCSRRAGNRGREGPPSAPATGSFRGGLVVLVLALWLLGACRPLAAIPDRLDDVISTQAVRDQNQYAEAIKAWTRSGTIYRKFNTELLVTATYHSLPFRQAYVAAYAQAVQLTDEHKLSLWEQQAAELKESHEFLLAAFVPESDASDLANPGSGWRLYLETDGGDRLSPQDVRRIRKITPFITGFYPYVTPWAKVYKVRFPTRRPGSGDAFPGPRDQSLYLVITSPSGMVRLTWQPESESTLSSLPEGSEDLGRKQTGERDNGRFTASPN